MKQPQHIPTIIALLLLIIGMGSTVFLVNQGQNLFTRASSDSQPQHITITNISDTSFSVSWITSKKTRGVISYNKKSGKKMTALDDRDDKKPNKYYSHHVTLQNLDPDTIYYFSIFSENKEYHNNDTSYQVKTPQALALQTSSHPPIYGTIKTTDDQPGSETLIYITFTSSQMLSTVSQNDGRFILPISPIRDSSLSKYFSITPNHQAEITMRGTNTITTTITTSLKNATPLPLIVLGKNYDFRYLQGKIISSLTYLTNRISSKIKTIIAPIVYASTKIQILQPEEGTGIPSNTPLFKGTGIAGKEVVTTVGIPVQTGKIWIDSQGSWSWAPPNPLQAGTHVLTITTYDEEDNAVALARQFTILKSGSSVLDAATPSATITPISTISASPTASASAQPIPVSGIIKPTLAMIFASILFVSIGVFAFII